MRIQAIQLFRDVNTLRHHYQFLLKAIVFQLDFSIFQFGDQTLTLPFDDFRHLRTHFADFLRNPFQTLLNHRFQCGAFAFACRNEIIQCTIQRLQQLRVNSIQILLLCRHHTGPAQDIQRINRAFIALHFHPVGRLHQLFRQRFIEHQLALRAGIGIKTQVALNFTARQTLANAFADNRLQPTKLFRQTDVGFQITLVNRTQLPGGAAPFAFGFAAGISGHTADHKRYSFAERWVKYSEASHGITGISVSPENNEPFRFPQEPLMMATDPL